MKKNSKGKEVVKGLQPVNQTPRYLLIVAPRSFPQLHSQSLLQNGNSSMSPSEGIQATKAEAKTPDSFCLKGMTTDLEVALLNSIPHDSNGETVIGNIRLRKMHAQQIYMTVSDSSSSLNQIRVDLAKELEGLGRVDRRNLTNFYLKVLRPAFPITVENDLTACPIEAKMALQDKILQSAICAFSFQYAQAQHSSHSAPTEQIRRLRAVVLQTVQSSLKQPTLSTIQAGLLLYQDPDIVSPSLTAQLVVAGNTLGLNHDCADWMIDAAEKRLRKRLAWTLYAQDKWNALVYGCPSLIQPSNWTVKRLCLEDFELHSSNAEECPSAEKLSHGAALFMQMIDLTGILSDILGAFFTIQATGELKAAGSSECSLILARAKPIQIKLKHWFSSLPPLLKMDMSVDDEFLSNGPLHLAYFATEITLHRCIIRSIKPDTDEYLAYICRAAAKTRLISAMDFVNRLRPAHLDAFWPFSARINFALIGTFGTLLRITAPTFEEAEFYRMRLAEYRWTLAVSRKTHDFFSYAIQSLDAADGAVQHVPVKPPFKGLHPPAQANNIDSQLDTNMADTSS